MCSWKLHNPLPQLGQNFSSTQNILPWGTNNSCPEANVPEWDKELVRERNQLSAITVELGFVFLSPFSHTDYKGIILI